MNDDDTFKAVLVAFKQLSVAELTNALLGSPVTASRYAQLSQEERGNVTREIDARAEKIAVLMAETLRRRGLLGGTASPATVNQIYRQCLARLSNE